MNTAKLITLIEKTHYPFKSYPKTSCETILFPGCAFQSQFPRTMERLSELCRAAGFGIIYDCCGDPLEGYGKEDAAQRVLRNLNRKLKELGCKRLVLVCPTCRKHLTGKLECEVVTIYDVIDELDVDLPQSFGEGSMHIPCPDKKTKQLETSIRQLSDMEQVQTITRAGCCGLRADLASRGPEYVKKLSNIIIENADGGMLYTYCASCLGQFSRMGYNDCRHVVSVLLGIDEEPDSAHALMNRAKRKFDRNTNPSKMAVS